jgi:chemotaxis protein MotB
VAVLLGSASGCVTTGTYDKKVAEFDQLRTNHDRTVAERDGLRKKLDDATALVGEFTARLEKLGQNVGKLTSENGQLAQCLADTKACLDELRRQEAVTEARVATFRNLVARLRSIIDAGQLKVAIRDGRMLIVLPNDVLFDSDKTNIKSDGQAALAQVAKVLATIPEHNFLVAGDTDDVPIHTFRFPMSWELSTKRAVEVTKFLVANGMRPQVLAAAGYGEFDPVVANDSSSIKHRIDKSRSHCNRISPTYRRSTM